MKPKTPTKMKKVNSLKREMEKQKIRNYLWDLNNYRLWRVAEEEWYKKHKGFWNRVFYGNYNRFMDIKNRQTELFENEFYEVLK